MSALPPPLPGPATPLDPPARTAGLDVARGLAILGLAFANVPFFASADFYREWAGQAPARDGIDIAGDLLVEFFVVGKCITLLAFLLGVGLAHQELRARATGADFVALTLRRMGALLVIGLAHILLLWWGDVLCAYAILGAALLLVRGFAPRTRRWLALGLCAITLAVMAPLTLLLTLLPPAIAAQPFLDMAAAADRVYPAGGVGAIVLLRISETLNNQGSLALMGPYFFGLVVLGYDAVVTGWLPRADHRPRLPRWVPPVVIAGLALNAVAAVASAFAPGASLSLSLAVLAGLPGAAVLAGVYLLWATRLPGPGVRAVVAGALAAVGRTALSNYLLQSLLFGLVFYGYGLGLFGRLSGSGILLVAAAVALTCVVWSSLWLRAFRFGPMEALWRAVTYGPGRRH